jgi:hypothetical protein
LCGRGGGAEPGVAVGVPQEILRPVESTGASESHAEIGQLLAKVIASTVVDRVDAELSGALRIERSVVDERARFGRTLREIEGQPVDGGVGLANAHVAGADKDVEAIRP